MAFGRTFCQVQYRVHTGHEKLWNFSFGCGNFGYRKLSKLIITNKLAQFGNKVGLEVGNLKAEAITEF